MRVALKYCGGCDPAYERVEYVQRIQALARDQVEWVRLEEGDYQAVLLVCGCATACPEEEMPDHAPLICIKNDSLEPALVLAQIMGKG